MFVDSINVFECHLSSVFNVRQHFPSACKTYGVSRLSNKDLYLIWIHVHVIQQSLQVLALFLCEKIVFRKKW